MVIVDVLVRNVPVFKGSFYSPTAIAINPAISFVGL